MGFCASAGAEKTSAMAMAAIFKRSMAFLSTCIALKSDFRKRRSVASELLRHVLVRIFRFAILLVLLPLRKLHFLARRFLVRDLREQVTDDVEPDPALVLRARHVPRGKSRIGCGEHLIPSA